MPLLILDTNVSDDKFPADFLTKLNNVLSKTIGKPVEKFAVTIHSGLKMSFGGTTEPCANVQLYSIGKLGEQENPGHSAEISKYLKDSLGIQLDRMYIVFNDVDSTFWGTRGTSVSVLIGQQK